MLSKYAGCADFFFCIVVSTIIPVLMVRGAVFFDHHLFLSPKYFFLLRVALMQFTIFFTPFRQDFLFLIPVKPTIFCMHITYIHRNTTYIYNEPLATTSVIDGNIVLETVFILIIFIEHINGFCSHR